MSTSLLRKIIHLVGGSLLPILGLVLPRAIFLSLLGAAVLFFWGFDLARWRYPRLNRWSLIQAIGLKPQEQRGLNGASYLLLAALIVFLAFETKVAALALLFLTVGDPVAAVVGRRWGRHRLRGKSIEGSLAFMVSALVPGLLLAPAFGLKIGVVILAAGVASLLELLSLPPDDNLIVPPGAALVIFLLSHA